MNTAGMLEGLGADLDPEGRKQAARLADRLAPPTGSADAIRGVSVTLGADPLDQLTVREYAVMRCLQLRKQGPFAGRLPSSRAICKATGIPRGEVDSIIERLKTLELIMTAKPSRPEDLMAVRLSRTRNQQQYRPLVLQTPTPGNR